MKFQDFLTKLGIVWSPSTPHYPQSNGMAEAAVKNMKNLLDKCEADTINSEEFLEGLLEYSNTPRECGYSPNQVIYGQNLRSLVPVHETAASKDTSDVQNVYFDESSRDFYVASNSLPSEFNGSNEYRENL